MTDSEARLEAAIEARSTICFAVDQIEALSTCGISLVHDWDMYGRDHEDAANILELLLHSIKGIIKPLDEPFEALSWNEDPPEKPQPQNPQKAKAKVTPIEES